MMRDVSRLDTSVALFGEKFDLPVIACPAGVHKLMHSDGEAATARAFARAECLMGVSQHATLRLEDVAAAAPAGRRWYQAYILKDRELTAAIVQRAERAGYKAIILTVDSPVFGFREADARNSFKGLPPGFGLPNYPSEDGYGDRAKDAWDQNTEQLFDVTISWPQAIDFLRSVTSLPIVVKGVMIGEEATAAMNAGADGIWVSNHGARQLDGVLSTIEALPEVVTAVRSHPRGRNAPIILDSGVRRGTDVIKCLALGANAVAVGKPIFFSLACGGQQGVAKMLDIFRTELESAMALLGISKLDELDETYVTARRDGLSHYQRAKL